MRLPVVRGDTPQVLISLVNPLSGLPVDISPASTVVTLRIRPIAGALKASVACTKLTGRVRDDQTIDTDPPYHVAGVGGRAVASCPANVFDAEGSYEGEIRVTSGSGTIIRTAYSLISFTVRNEIA